MTWLTTFFTAVLASAITLLMQSRIKHYGRPKLRLGPFKKEPPFFRHAPEGAKKVTAYYINIPLTNIGRRLAHRCQPVLTAWRKTTPDEGWRREKNWVPVGLVWVLDEWQAAASGKPTHERELIPEPSFKTSDFSPPRYLFNLGKISDEHPGEFDLQLITRPHGQPSRFPPGEYCFQITAYSEDADWDEKWYRVHWLGDRTGAVAPEQIEVCELPNPPWTTGSGGAMPWFSRN